MTKLLSYKGIVFDDYVKDDDGHYWAEMCYDCLEKYKSALTSEIKDDGGCGTCSVKGCTNNCEWNGASNFYIDFNDELITWKAE